jgi:hypothetical protein
MSPATQLQLDVMCSGGCQKPGCKCGRTDRLFFSSKCHPERKTCIVGYEKGGRLGVFCATCQQPIVFVKVAKS